MVRYLIGVLSLFVASDLAAAEPKAAYDMLPQSVQAVVWVRSSEAIAERWNRTELARLADDAAIRDFWDDQRQQIEEKLTSAGWRLQIQPRDLEDIVQGQIALAWINRSSDTRRPFAMALIVDIVDKVDDTKKLLERLNKQLKDRGATVQTLTHNGVEVVQHTLPRQNGEILPQDTFYATTQDQLLASDDLTTLQGLIDAAAGKSTSDTLAADPMFQAARKELQVSDNAQVEYFVRPLGFARVLRAMSGKRAGGNADVLAVQTNQGFESIKAVCGELKLGEEKYDILHRGYVLADENRPKSVQVLDFPNEVRREVPPWVLQNVSSLMAACWNVKDAFWKVEGLVDEMAGEPGVFHEIIEGIKVDPTGPRIDIAKDVMPLLTNEIYSVTDTKMPIEVDSRRNLIALRVTEPSQMAKILRRAMENEPDAQEVSLNGQQIWQVVHKEEEELALELDGFGAFGPKPGNAKQQDKPWLSNWAITVHGDYLMFASHVELISEAIAQANAAKQSPLADEQDYKRVIDALVENFGDEPGFTWHINRSELAYRPQYELFRAGKLQESQSMLASLLEHLLQNKAEIKEKKPVVDGAKLPPFESVSKYLQPSGMAARTTDKGWSFGSVLLSKAGDDRTQAKQGKPTSETSSGRESNAANKSALGERY